MSSRSRLTVLAAAVLSVGCYTLQPVVSTTALEGKPIAFDITDAGRVALGGSMGPAIRRVEGRLVGATSDAYTVSVTSVDFLAGGSQAWTGDTVQLRREHVGVAYQRRLSKARTIAAGAAAVGVVAFIVTRSLNGGGDPEDRPAPRDSIGTTSRGPRP